MNASPLFSIFDTKAFDAKALPFDLGALQEQFHAHLTALAVAGQAVLTQSEKALAVGTRALEKNLAAGAAHLGSVAAAKDLSSHQTLIPQGLQVLKDQHDRLVEAGKEIFNLNLQTGKELGELAKERFQATEQAVKSAVETVKATASKASKR